MNQAAIPVPAQTPSSAAFDAVLFDLDGTLLDTLQDLWFSVNAALNKHGLPERSLSDVRFFTGNGIKRLIDLSVPEGLDPERTAQVFADFKAIYAEHAEDHTGPYPGIVELLDSLKEADMPLGVISNKADFAVQPLIAKTFPGYFGAVTGERAGLPRKPERALIDWARQTLGVSPDARVAYVGDSEVDIATAQNSDCVPLICTWGFRDRQFLIESGAQVLVDTPQELLELLRAH